MGGLACLAATGMCCTDGVCFVVGRLSYNWIGGQNESCDPKEGLRQGMGSMLAYYDSTFLESDDGRVFRILAEYAQPMRVFSKEKIQNTIVFFGSARLQETGPHGCYYAAAMELARLITQWSGTEHPVAERHVVCTGGGGGIMEAANRGAAEAGGRTIGLNIGLPFEQRPNAHITPGLGFEFRYFFMRKLWFAHLARAMIVFPGGFGTLDELFEILTLSQTHKLARPIPVLLYNREYWEKVINFESLVQHGMISESDLSLFHYIENPAEALGMLKKMLGPIQSPGFAKTVSPPCDV